MPWCRKCRRFSKTFFVEEREKHGPEVAKHRTSLIESTDVLPQKYRCFYQRSPMFLFSGIDAVNADVTEQSCREQVSESPSFCLL